jgi:hypothetical protein
MTVPSGWPPLAVPFCPLHDVKVALDHVPDHAWLCLSEKDWAVNLSLYATQPERLLQLQCEGECWCSPPDARARGWAGHGRGPTACVFESNAFDEGATRALVAARQAQSLGQLLPPVEPSLMVQTIAALAHQPGWCACLPSILMRLDALPEFLSRGWSFETFPTMEPASAALHAWIDMQSQGRWTFLWGEVGRGKTGLAAAVGRRFLADDTTRTAFHGRLSQVREEMAGENGALLARWLEVVDLLILDDLDFGWVGVSDGDRGSLLLAECLSARLAIRRRVLMTGHRPPEALPENMNSGLRAMLASSDCTILALTGGPSLRTGRVSRSQVLRPDDGHST